MNLTLVQVVEQNQMEDPLAMSLATFAMSRPGSVMDDRPGSAMSIISNVSPTKTPVRTRKMRNAFSMNTIDTNSRGEGWSSIGIDDPGLTADDGVAGERIRDLEFQLGNQQENFMTRLRDMETIIKKQEETIAKMKVNGHVD